jgi:general secretion pathway protein D
MTRPPFAAPIATLLLASLTLQPVLMAGEGPYVGSSTTEAAVQRELARREARRRQGLEEIRLGKEALKKRDYEAAFAHYNNAANAIAASDATRSEREQAVDGLTIAGRRLAEQRVTEGYYASAVQILQEVLRHNPNDKATLKLLANIEAPDYFNKAMTPQHRANVEEVKANFVKGNQYRDLGRNNLALLKAEQIIDRDPDNIAAKKLRGELYEVKNRAAEAGYDAARSQAMWEVTRQWERPHRRFNTKVVEISRETRTSAPSTAGIMRKLTEIKLPKVDFREATVREAMEFLQQRARTLDPEGLGVNIVLKLEEQGGVVTPPPAPAPAPGLAIPGLDVPGAPPAAVGGPVVSGGSGTRITLTLNNVPLIEVIKYIVNLANLKYKVDPYAVYIVPLGFDTSEMYIKEWKVPASIFREVPGGGAATPIAGAPAPDPTLGGGGSSLAGSSSAKDFLQSRGVTFGQNAFAMFSPASSTLIVKNTQEQLDLVERVIEVVQGESAIKQIEIQAKFVEITQNNLKELSFDWLLGAANVPGISTQGIFFSGGTAGTAPQVDPADFSFSRGGTPIGTNPVTSGLRSGSLGISANAIDALLFGLSGSTLKAPGIFGLTGAGTDPTFQVMIRALDQKKGVDLLSAPRVTTKSGNRAVIEIIREFKYPIEFEQPQIPQTFGNTGGFIQSPLNPLASSSGSFPVTPTTPTTFETRNTGVTLEVEPNIGPDGASIEMQLAPQVVEFEGFINYGSPIQTTSTNALGQQVVNVITPNVINQPIFSTRKVSTNVTVFDGATVVLGGLVREDVQKVEDKIPLVGDLPLVGRLFRSNVDQHIKRNLVIFVTARIINAEGQPIVSDDEKEEVVDELGLPEIAPPALPEMNFKEVVDFKR